jgi:hypothetical protein
VVVVELVLRSSGSLRIGLPRGRICSVRGLDMVTVVVRVFAEAEALRSDCQYQEEDWGE